MGKVGSLQNKQAYIGPGGKFKTLLQLNNQPLLGIGMFYWTFMLINNAFEDVLVIFVNLYFEMVGVYLV